MAADCLFCKIINGEIPSDKVHETETVYVFKDISPVAPIHYLIIPKKHIVSIDELGEEDRNIISDIMFEAQHLGKTIKELNGNYRILSSTGPDAGQVVMHMHFHLIGGRKLNWPPG